MMSTQMELRTLKQKRNRTWYGDDEEEPKDYKMKQTYTCCFRSTEGFMIMCDKCSSWFHGLCIGVSLREARKLKEFFCSMCETQQMQQELKQSLQQPQIALQQQQIAPQQLMTTADYDGIVEEPGLIEHSILEYCFTVSQSEAKEFMNAVLKMELMKQMVRERRKLPIHINSKCLCLIIRQLWICSPYY